LVRIAEVTFSGPGGTSDLGLCGTLTVADERSKVMYRNVAGKATLACDSGPRIEGHIKFEDCH
jgi:hypothetical protein